MLKVKRIRCAIDTPGALILLDNDTAFCYNPFED